MKKPLAALVLFALATAANAVTIAVSGSADSWLAGVSAASTASLGDLAPNHSAVQAKGIAFRAGDTLRISAKGETDHCDDARCGLAGPDGDLFEDVFVHTTGAENGIADIAAPIDSLIGVFLDSNQPELSPAPVALDFTKLEARDFSVLSPLPKQPFFIGDGLRNDGITPQDFIAPAGSTRLYLGTMDGFGWYNNVGSLLVTVEVRGAHEPSTLALALGCLLWFSFWCLPGRFRAARREASFCGPSAFAGRGLDALGNR